MLSSGTHVSSTAAGRSVGVAKDASVVGVRVLDCDGAGSISNVVAGELGWLYKCLKLWICQRGYSCHSYGSGCASTFRAHDAEPCKWLLPANDEVAYYSYVVASSCQMLRNQETCGRRHLSIP